jgi:hypothetical protein
MTFSTWLSDKLNLRANRAESTETRKLAQETYARVSEVSELRKTVLEDRDFPIVGLLRDRPLKPREVRE